MLWCIFTVFFYEYFRSDLVFIFGFRESFKKFYESYMEYRAPTEDIYIEWQYNFVLKFINLLIWF